METQILDCTIRDGGYINAWDFDRKMVRELYRSVSKSGVDYIEIGFKNKANDDTREWYSVTEELLSYVVDDIDGSKIALLADVGKIDLDAISEASYSHVDLYRIATHKNSLELAFDLSKKISGLGYQTSVQLMGIIGYTENELIETVSFAKHLNIDYLYFADSYGSMMPSEVAYYCEMLQRSGKKVGFHAHNNLQLAFANTLEAIRNNVDMVDATVFGMGRGAGNVPLEALIIYLQKITGNSKYDALPVLDLADRYFYALTREFEWGYQLPYMLSGILKVHPTYARELVERHEYGMEDMVNALEDIRNKVPVGFNKKTLDEVIEKKFIMKTNGEMPVSADTSNSEVHLNYINRHQDKDFMVLATGPSLKKSKTDIDRFIKKYDPVIVGANFLENLFTPHYHLFSNKKRFQSYIDDVSPDSRLIISSYLDPKIVKEYTQSEYEIIYHRYGDNFQIQDRCLIGDFRTVVLLGIGTAIAMGAKRIFIVGMDGYQIIDSSSPDRGLHFYKENQEAEKEEILLKKHTFNEKMLDQMSAYFSKIKGQGNFNIITPTSHSKYYSNIKDWI